MTTDNELKNLFANLNVPEPKAGFEDMVIANALSKKAEVVQLPKRQSFLTRTANSNYARVAAVCLFVMSATLLLDTNSSTTAPVSDTAEYASLVDESFDEELEDFEIALN